MCVLSPATFVDEMIINKLLTNSLQEFFLRGFEDIEDIGVGNFLVTVTVKLRRKKKNMIDLNIFHC